MTATGRPLAPDRAQIVSFVDALFRYADLGTYVSLRAFPDGAAGPPFCIESQVVGDDRQVLINAAVGVAGRCAAATVPVVFCPPVATFLLSGRATESDLANGLALSVECDARAEDARARLEFILGHATVVVASGGEWLDPSTGELQPKLHLHWRLTEPTRTADEHAKLKRLRAMATALVGGDASNKPIVHPIRWPGSWHRKSTPRMARIISLSEEREIDLAEALSRLEDAAPASAPEGSGADTVTKSSGEQRATDELIATVLQGTDFHAPLVALAMRFLKAGMLDGPTTLVLQGVMCGVPEHLRDVKDGVRLPGRWQARYDDISRAVSTARAKLGVTRSAGKPELDEWPEPLDFLGSNEMTGAPILRADHLPAALWPFVADTAARMGVDPASMALAALVALASVANDAFALQPKRADNTWVENPRIWGAIVGEPSILKTPVLRAATQPIDLLEVEARSQHARAAQQHKLAMKTWKDAGSDPASEPRLPPLQRYLVEGATIEALSEALRDDPEARQCAPTGKILVRQDELSEFLANLDRYKTGGTGGGDRGAYLRLYNGGRYTIDRIQRGSFAIPNWSATFIGGIQPEPIQRIAQSAANDGLLQRFIYVVPGHQGEGEDRKPDQQGAARYSALFPALAIMSPGGSAHGLSHGPIVLHADAHQHREAINLLARGLAGMPDTSPRLSAALGKWPGLFARLALLFHLIEVADANARGEVGPVLQVLPEATAARAAAYMRDIVLPHLLRADALMFLTAQTGHARWIAGHILARSLTRITARDVVRAYRALEAPEQKRELHDVLDSLVTVGWLRPEVSGNPAKPTTAWEVSPRVHTAFAPAAAHERERRARAQQETADAIRRSRGRTA